MSHWAETLFREQAELYTRFFAERFDAARDETGQLLDLAAATYDADPDSVLDLACGTGRHVVAFADRGLTAEGIDFSTVFVERAREHASDAGVADRATVRHQDLRDLDELDGSYDLVTSFWNSLGYYGRETDAAMLSEVRRLLAEDGVLAVELGNRAHYLANHEGSSVHEGPAIEADDDGGGAAGGAAGGDDAAGAEGDATERMSVVRREYDVETCRFHTRLDLFEATEEGYEFDHTMEWENRMYTAPVLRRLCEEAGFEDVAFFGGFDGADLTLETDTLVLLAR